MPGKHACTDRHDAQPACGKQSPAGQRRQLAHASPWAAGAAARAAHSAASARRSFICKEGAERGGRPHEGPRPARCSDVHASPQLLNSTCDRSERTASGSAHLGTRSLVTDQTPCSANNGQHCHKRIAGDGDGLRAGLKMRSPQNLPSAPAATAVAVAHAAIRPGCLSTPDPPTPSDHGTKELQAQPGMHQSRNKSRRLSRRRMLPAGGTGGTVTCRYGCAPAGSPCFSMYSSISCTGQHKPQRRVD